MFKRNPFNPPAQPVEKAKPALPQNTVYYPPFRMPSNFRYAPAVNCGYVSVDPLAVHIDIGSVRSYLEKSNSDITPLERDLIEALKMNAEIHEKKSWWQTKKNTAFYHYFIHLGKLIPTQRAPWYTEKETDDYLTIVATDPCSQTDANEIVGVRYYVSLEEHNRLLREAQTDIRAIVREQVERGVSAGVEKAVTQQVKTLEQVQTERERLEAQLAELKATEARMIETERRQQERDERLQQRQAEKAAQRQTRNRAGYVYVARGEYGGQVAYKIGRSVNPNSRAKTFGVQLPFSVEFVALIQSEDMYALESELHRHYDHQGKWLAGEWFNLEANDIEYIKSLGNAA